MPKISVIIPCYNVERYIDRCLVSIIKQTIGIENLEIIIIDDASTDNTWEHLMVWEQAYSKNIMLIHQEINRRQGTARNLGLSYASADWIAFVDADDWLEPDYFAQLYDCAMTYACDIVCCESERDFSDNLIYFAEETRENGEDLYIMPDTDSVRKEVIATKFIVSVWGMIIQKNLLIDFDIIFPEDLVYEDMYWHPLVRIYSGGIYILGKKLYHYFVNVNSTVLARNRDYHIDWLTVWRLLWIEYGKRGILERYREELEYNSMENAVSFLRLLFLRYDNPSFSLFQLARQILMEQVPNHWNNPYTKRFTGIRRVLLEKLYQESFYQKDFEVFAEYAKNQCMIE